jgi:hypothetical protein
MRVRGPVAFLLNFASTIAKFLIRQRKPPSQSSGTSLNDHGQDLVAVDLLPCQQLTFACCSSSEFLLTTAADVRIST